MITHCRIVQFQNEQKEIEYHLVDSGLDDFGLIENTLLKAGCKLIERIDGIYSIVEKLDKEGHALKLIYHEDIGC